MTENLFEKVKQPGWAGVEFRKAGPDGIGHTEQIVVPRATVRLLEARGLLRPCPCSDEDKQPCGFWVPPESPCVGPRQDFAQHIAYALAQGRAVQAALEALQATEDPNGK